jgi:hypothetical protein
MNTHENLGHRSLNHEHLSDDALIDALYGIASVEAEVRECAWCAARWSDFQAKRTAAAEMPQVPSEVLAAQRRKIYDRIEHPARMDWARLDGTRLDWTRLDGTRMRWLAPAVAAAAACVLALGVWVHHPAENGKLHRTAVSESSPLPEVYSDVYAMEQSFEPTASESFQVLFESDGADSGARQGAKQ